MATDATRDEAAAVLGVMVQRMQRYEELLADLREGRIDMEAFRRLAVTTGLIVDNDGAWIFDLANTRWVYYDGVELLPVGKTPIKAAPSRRRRTT